jgi:formylmethanofuran dehydrogenase subunit E
MVCNAARALLCGLASLGFAQTRAEQLPQPDFHRQASDPLWLVEVVRFHGHLGPMVVAGARMGMAGLRAVEAKGYFDVEVTCEGPFARPPQACFLDGLQVATGATLGKRTLHWVPADRIAVRVKNLRSSKTAELRPTAALAELLASLKARPQAAEAAATGHQATHEHLEAVARKIAAMPEKEIVTVRVIDALTPQ